jgi:spermidine synthase
MPPTFRELDWRQTPMGDLILRLRRSPSLGGAEVYEVTLNGEFLMSSAVHRSEAALAELALEAFGEDRPRDVLVGGLGLGHTAVAALRDERVRRLDVVESLEPVIGWHRDRRVPAAAELMEDPRCRLIHDDFFRRVEEADGAEPRCDLILVDIDHSPDAWLDDAHGRFYSEAGLGRLTDRLNPGGVFALWSAELVDEPFLDRLRRVFEAVREHPIAFRHPMLHREEQNAVVVAQAPH